MKDQSTQQPAARARHRIAPHWAIALLILPLAGFLLTRARAAEPLVAPDAALGVASLRVVASAGYEVKEQYTGRVTPRRSSRLGFTGGGRLEEVLAEEGDGVEVGQLLARLDAAKLRVARREHQASVEEIEARLDLARLTLHRRGQLAGQDSISVQRHDEARAEERALRARLTAARAAIERVEVDIEETEIRAPYAGSIVARSADEGTILAPGQEVLRLIESGALEARIGVPIASAERLRAGSRHALQIEGVEVESELTALLDEVASETRTVTAVFRILPRDETSIAAPLRSGTLARLQLRTLRKQPGFWLPISALAESRRGLWSAFVLSPGNPGDASGVPIDAATADLYRVDRRELQVLHAETDRAYLRGTLSDGEQVVASGLHRLVPGQLVRITREQR